MAATTRRGDIGVNLDHAAMTMPSFTLRPPSLADRVQALVQRMQALGRRPAVQGRAVAETRPLRSSTTGARWQVLGAATFGLILLTLYVLTLQTAVERGEALRAQQRQQGINKFGAGAPATKPQKVSSSSTGS